ncbi:MarR family transcriptional regulator [Halobellus marinus]|uniref:MarR family transcriptional regulator n=1 Tax=Halobellus TaxID=1073986 RepID=UPI0028B19F05|nr:helix-turn-helix domain-containing protein [Halobellus sp. DFY28]
MPIDIDRFESDPESELRASGRTNAEHILSFLAGASEKAFTPQEIHEATDVPRGSVGVVLSRLEDRDLVRHRGEYWAIAESVDVDVTLAAMTTARTATERLGSEDPEEWGPGIETDDEAE